MKRPTRQWAPDVPAPLDDERAKQAQVAIYDDEKEKFAKTPPAPTPPRLEGLGRPERPERPEYLERPECPEGEVPWNDIEQAIETTALSKPKSSDNLIREFGRRLRGIEEVSRMKFSPKTLLQIFLKWELRNKKYLIPERDYFPEFLRKYGTVRVPYGATLRVALEAARNATPPTAATVLRDPDAHVLGSVCRELGRMAGKRPFLLKHAAIAALLHRPRRTITEWLAALETLNVIKRKLHGHPGGNGKRGEASEYYYLGD